MREKEEKTMKRFNLAVVIAWFAFFGLSLRTTPSNYEEFGVLDRVATDFNVFVWSHCEACAAGGEETIPLDDARKTGIILTDTFEGLVLFVFAANLFFYVGKASGAGKIGPAVASTKAAVSQFVGRVHLPRRKQATAPAAPLETTQVFES
jgi:hypothetical protein